MRTDRGGKGGVIINVSSAAGKEPPLSLTCLYDFVHLRKQKISLTLWKYLLYMNGLFWHNTNFNFDRDYYMYNFLWIGDIFDICIHYMIRLFHSDASMTQCSLLIVTITVINGSFCLVEGLNVNPLSPVYSATKAAIVALTRSLAVSQA